MRSQRLYGPRLAAGLGRGNGLVFDVKAKLDRMSTPKWGSFEVGPDDAA
jgi:hypothetical protein